MAFLNRIVHSLNRLTHSQGIRLLVNHRYARYGHMTELKIDDQLKTIEGTVLLKGETSPIEFRLIDYALTAAGEHGTITVGDITVSREWMQTLAREMVVGKAFPLPPGVGKWLNLVL